MHTQAHSAPTPRPPVFITAAYGDKYAAFLGVLLESLRRVEGRAGRAAEGAVLYQDIPAREVEVLRRAYPGMAFIEHAFERGSDPMHAIPRKLHAWLEGARRFPDRAAVFLDCDTLVVRGLDDVLDSGGDWDVLFTWKDELYPINTGVMAARSGEVAAHLFSALLVRVERMIASRAEMQVAVGSSGAADQHALREVIGFCNYDAVFHRPVEAAGRTRELVFRGEPCRVMNETNCRPLDPELRVVHYKTGWHPILLEGRGYTEKRSASASADMLRLWRETEAQGSTHAAAELARSGAREALERFIDIAGGYEERGILHSEMLAVCGVCRSLGVDIVVESGRCRGQSTLVLAKFFEGTGTRVVSIELARDENAAFAESRLAAFKHVELLYGDAGRLVPEVLARFGGKRVALLLDGPKGQEATDLARRAFDAHPQLHAAFIHDMRAGTPQRAALEREPLRSFFTDDAEYLREFARVDEACLPRAGAAITPHTWRPYMKGTEKIPAYGPTLAVVLARPGRPLAVKSAFAPDTVPNRLLRATDWGDARYTALRETFNTIYRDELKGAPHPAHAKHPERVVTHWSREWEYPYAVINSEVTPGMRVVDLGCGGSPLIPYFVTRAGCTAAGVDLNLTNTPTHNLRGFVGPPEKMFPQVRWVLRSMADTGLPGGQWDRVLCISVLEHVTEELARATLREVRRLLAPGGRSVITTDVDGEHRTLTIDFRRIIELAGGEGLKLRGECDFSVPPSADRPGTYDVVGMVFEAVT